MLRKHVTFERITMKHFVPVSIQCLILLSVFSVYEAAAAEERPSVEGVLTERQGSNTLVDLTHWKLTLPVDAAGTYGGHAAEVSAERLTAGFQNSHFQYDQDGALVFWCPVCGATTEDTEFPRSELREMLRPNDPSVNWNAKGTHILTARCRVVEVPSNPKVIIGQIHGYSGKARPLIKLQYFKGRIEALVKSSPSKGKDIKLVWPDVRLNTEVTYRIALQNEILSLTVNGVTQTQDIANNDPEWMKQTFYFKAGIYPQDNEGPPSEGGRVVFSELKVRHTK